MVTTVWEKHETEGKKLKCLKCNGNAFEVFTDKHPSKRVLAYKVRCLCGEPEKGRWLRRHLPPKRKTK